MSVDWESGTYRAGGAAEATVRVSVASDWAPIRGFADALARDPEPVYGDLLPGLRASDLRIVNLEAPLTGADGAVWKDGPNLRGSPDAVAGLTAVPFDVACLANNHALDYGPAGLQETVEVLARAGIRAVGAGLSPDAATAPLRAQVAGVRLGIVNFCEGEDCTAARDGPGVHGWEVDRVVRTVRELAAESDAVLAVAHCGREYAPLPPPYVVDAFRRIAEAGASAVIGHHPHVPQGIEVHGGCPILYSMGNFVFDQSVDQFYRRAGYLVQLDLSPAGLCGLQIVPYSISPRGLQAMRGATRRWFLGRLQEVSAPLADRARVRAAWEAFVDGVGLEAELAHVAGGPELSLEQWAALRNRFVTPAHRVLWIDGITRILDGETGTAPAWARALVDEWRTLTVEEAQAAAGRMEEHA